MTNSIANIMQWVRSCRWGMKHVVQTALLLGLLLASLPALAQNGQFQGLVTDQHKAVVVGAEVRIVNQTTGVERKVVTNKEGLYTAPFVFPGIYKISVSAPGFSIGSSEQLTLTVGQTLAFDVELKVGSEKQEVIVHGETQTLNTTDASVSTIVDRQFVENLPLNGRSFQDLILLAPGVVTGSPQGGGTGGPVGDFSVNGQTYFSNNYIVDGVSANFSGSQITSAILPAETVLGTTQSMLSIDNLQEVRIETSSYSAEYGTAPGGQFSFTTRSGTNNFHGNAFDYLRNNFFDAENWFNNYYGVTMAPYRQNDFGGTLGGPVLVPKFYNGKDKAFFFLSYEGLRLLEPQSASTTYVPSVAQRSDPNVLALLQQDLNGYPLPNTSVASTGVKCSTNNGTTGASDGSNTIGFYNGYPCPLSTSGTPETGTYVPSGLAPFVTSYSTPTNLDAYSARLDYNFTSKMNAFFRWSYTPSVVDGQFQAILTKQDNATKNYTLGVTDQISSRMNNSFRLNYGYNTGYEYASMNSFGGATPFNLNVNAGVSQYPYPQVVWNLFVPGAGSARLYSNNTNTYATQWNLVDTLSVIRGRHQLKFGVNWRRILTPIGPMDPRVQTQFRSPWQLENNWSPYVWLQQNLASEPLYHQFALFAQDEWRLASRLNLSLGLRWDLDPAPTNAGGQAPLVMRGSISDPTTWTMSPRGTAIWDTAKFNFSPRMGVAYQLRAKQGWESVLRAGGGVFFDTDSMVGGETFSGVGFAGGKTSSNNQNDWPISPALIAMATPSSNMPYNGTAYYYPEHLQLPYTLEWNVSAQQALGGKQSITAAYVGSSGRRMLDWENVGNNQANGTLVNTDFSGAQAVYNHNGDEYNALQVSFQRKLSRGIQALASYTWSHSIAVEGMGLGTLGGYNDHDQFPESRGNADLDLRHNLQAALSWNLPSVKNNRILDAALSHWGTDARFFLRTGFPVTVGGPWQVDPVTGLSGYSGMELTGAPLYIYGAACNAYFDSPANGNPNNGLPCPGGRAINPLAYQSTNSFTYNPAPRNYARGFGENQINLAARREFPIVEGMALQFQAEAFNVFNHPNFGGINSIWGDTSQFGEAGEMLNTSGIGGLAAQYQQGGSRNLQFALKILF